MQNLPYYLLVLSNRAYNECLVSSQGPCDSLGISVAGGVGSPHGNIPLFIAAMDTNGLAAKTQQLQVGGARVYSIQYVCACVVIMLQQQKSILTVCGNRLLGSFNLPHLFSD